jgi:hypothetical protein
MITEEEEGEQSNEQKHRQIEQRYGEPFEYLANRDLGKCGNCHINNIPIVAIMHTDIAKLHMIADGVNPNDIPPEPPDHIINLCHDCLLWVFDSLTRL